MNLFILYMSDSISIGELHEYITYTEKSRDMKKFFYKISPTPYRLFVIKDLQRDLILYKRRYSERTGYEYILDNR